MKVAECMTSDIEIVTPDQPIREAAQFMLRADAGVMPVLSREDETLVGIVSLGDISRSEQGEAAALALDGITDPGGEHNQSGE